MKFNAVNNKERRLLLRISGQFGGLGAGQPCLHHFSLFLFPDY